MASPMAKMGGLGHLVCLVIFTLTVTATAAENGRPMTPEVFHMTPDYLEQMAGKLDKWRDQRSVYNGDQVSPQCARDVAVVGAAGEAPQNYTWILSVLDAQGNFPDSGVFLGKAISVGSYDSCVGVKPSYQRVYTENATAGETKYIGTHDFDMHFCQAKWEVPELKQINGEGWCVPKSCDRQDVVKMMPARPGRREAYCGTKQPFSQNVGAIISLSVFAVFTALVVIATILDSVYRHWEEVPAKDSVTSDPGHVMPAGHVTAADGDLKGTGGTSGDTAASSKEAGAATEAKKPTSFVAMRMLLCFSLWRTLPSVMATKSRGYDSMNGIRFLAMTWIVLGHTWGLFMFPYSANILSRIRNLQPRFSQQMVNGHPLAVDIFFFLSGTLVTVSFMKTLKRLAKEPRGTRGISAAKEIALYVFHRYWRLTPIYFAALMVRTYLWLYLGEGPLFPETRLPECTQSWWFNILYVNNFFGNGCMKWAWYLANDFQFYLVVPIFATALFLRPTGGSFLLTLAWAGSVVSRVALTMSGKNNFNDMYIKPYARFGPYAIGIATGYLMYRTRCKVKMNKVVVLIGWLVASALCALVAFGKYKRDTWSYDVYIAYHVTHRDAFALGISWIVFACSCGYGGLVNTFFSWSLWIPLSKLSYACFLIHPMIGFLAIINRRQLFQIQDITMIYLYFGNLMISLAVSLVTTLIFEVPFLDLEKIILPARKK